MQPNVNDLAKIATDSGVMDVAVDDLLFHVAEFDDSTGDIIHKATGLTAKAWLNAQREKRDAIFPIWDYVENADKFGSYALPVGNAAPRSRNSPKTPPLGRIIFRGKITWAHLP